MRVVYRIGNTRSAFPAEPDPRGVSEEPTRKVCSEYFESYRVRQSFAGLEHSYLVFGLTFSYVLVLGFCRRTTSSKISLLEARGGC